MHYIFPILIFLYVYNSEYWKPRSEKKQLEGIVWPEIFAFFFVWSYFLVHADTHIYHGSQCHPSEVLWNKVYKFLPPPFHFEESEKPHSIPSILIGISSYLKETYLPTYLFRATKIAELTPLKKGWVTLAETFDSTKH